MTSWINLRVATRTGAAHLRRVVSCQDASGLIRLNPTGADSFCAIVVADGHGGAAYCRSREGSRIACDVALSCIESHAARWAAADDLSALELELQLQIPEQIVSRWQDRVCQHWQEHTEPAHEPFRSLVYGTTLGIVLLTPHWWAHTGLGDWDLVRIDSHGEARLISEEGSVGGGSEATSSLCQGDASARFRSRTKLFPLSQAEPPFSLLLSTDGLRKSCSTDVDFCRLASYLLTSACSQPDQLTADLDQISAKGSGDDVSVACASWACGGDNRDHSRSQQHQNSELFIDQPPTLEDSAVALDGPQIVANDQLPLSLIGATVARVRSLWSVVFSRSLPPLNRLG